jgi:hypothetical protein
MNDQRRYGSDYDNSRNTSSDGGRQPHGGEDPLAELERLVQQSEANAALGRGGAQGARGQAPHFDDAQYYEPRGQEPRVDARYAEPRHADPRAHDPRVHAAQHAPSEPDFFQGEDPRGHQPADEFDYPETDEEYYARVGQYEDGHQAYAEPEGDLPARRRGGMFTVMAVLAVVVLGGLAALAYNLLGGSSTNTASSDGSPPVIEAARDPVKSTPEGNGNELPNQNKLIYDRVGAAPEGSSNVVGGAEEPGERPVGTGSDTASTNFGVPVNGAEPVPLDGGMRRVRTISIRPDGSVAPAPAAAPAPEATAALPEEEEPTGPIVGTGEAAGMSMERGPEFGIMASSEGANAAPSALVPMPMARPGSLQLRTSQASDANLLPPAGATPAATAPAPAAAAPAAPAAGRVAIPASQKTVKKRELKPPPIPAGVKRPPARSGALTSPTAVAVASAVSPGGYSVQLSSQSSEDVARQEFGSLQRRYPALLGGRRPNIVPVNLADRGTFYRVRVAAASQGEAANLCASLKAAGGDCIVQRN